MGTDRKPGIYKILNKVTGKFYIGSSVNIRVRINWHFRQLNNGCHSNQHLQKSWLKYGSDAFKFCIVEYCQKNQLMMIEQHYLDVLQAYIRGYNLSPSAQNNTGIIWSQESNKKRSMAHKGQVSKLKGVSSTRVGYKMSEETKRKISISHKGMIFSEGRCQNISLAKMGKPNSCKGKKRKPFTEEHRQKLSLAKKGKPWTRKQREGRMNTLKEV